VAFKDIEHSAASPPEILTSVFFWSFLPSLFTSAANTETVLTSSIAAIIILFMVLIFKRLINIDHSGHRKIYRSCFVKLLPPKREEIGVFDMKHVDLQPKKEIIRRQKKNLLFLQNPYILTNFPITFAPRENPVIRGLLPAFIYKKPLA
jgi:hypothetical protein